MKSKPIAFIKSLSWNKEDLKKILLLIIMLLITCLILNNFLLVKVRITQGRENSVPVDFGGYVDANVSGDINSKVLMVTKNDFSFR